MNFEEWQAQVKEWRAKYKTPIDLTKLSTYYRCVACDLSRMETVIHRHHKASDFIFALMYPEKYAKKYVQFRSLDCVPLCSKCHEEVERFYAPIKFKMYVQIDESGKLPLNKVDKFKSKFRKAYYSWLKNKKREVRNAKRSLGTPRR